MNQNSTPTKPQRTWGLITTPLRIGLALVVFAPVALFLKAITKLGELLAEIGEDFDYKWTKLAKDTAFLLHGASLETAQRQAEELRSLQARWDFFHKKEEEKKTRHIVEVAVVDPVSKTTGWREVVSYHDLGRANAVVDLNPNLHMRVRDEYPDTTIEDFEKAAESLAPLFSEKPQK